MFPNQICQINSTYSSLKNFVAIQELQKKQSIQIFLASETPSMPFCPRSRALLELAGLQMTIQEMRAEICKSKHSFGTDMPLLSEGFVTANTEQ